MLTPGVEVHWERISTKASSPRPRPRSFASLTSCGDRYLVLFGGCGAPTNPVTFFSDLWVFDCAESIWTEMPLLSATGRAHHQAFFVDGKLFVVGGQVIPDGETTAHCAGSIIVVERFLVEVDGTLQLQTSSCPVLREIASRLTPSVMSHGKSQIVLLPSQMLTKLGAPVASHRSVEEVLVTYGGHDGKVLLDGLAFFLFSQELWLDFGGSRFVFPEVDGRQKAGLEGCTRCEARGTCCAHQSIACNSYGIARKRLSAHRSTDQEDTYGPGGSLPPRCGHSMSLVSPIVAPSCDEKEVVEFCGELLLFGGEVGLCVSNTTFGVSIRCRDDKIVSTWRELCPGGSEYCKRRGLLQGQRPSGVESHHSAASSLATPPPDEAATSSCRHRQDEKSHLLRISESPHRVHNRRGGDGEVTPDRRPQWPLGRQLDVDHVPHTAFHCAWSAGSNGVVIYGGLNGATSTFNEQMYFFDIIRNAWFAVHCPSEGPGSRVGAAEVSIQAGEPCSTCIRCGAPATERHFLFGGENKLEQRSNDLYVFQLHAFGCAEETVSPLGRAAPELTPPPRRVPLAAGEISASTPGSRSVMVDGLQLPLKMIAAMILVRHETVFD